LELNKKIEKIEVIHKNNKIKNNIFQLNEGEKFYIKKSIEVNKLEKNLYNSLLANFLKKEDAKKNKNDQIKSTLLIALKNSLEKMNLNEIKNNEVKNNIECLKEKYKFDQVVDNKDSLNTGENELTNGKT